MRLGQSVALLISFGVATSLWLSEVWGICIKSGQANLRGRPSATKRVSWVVGRYMPLGELERQGRWIRVRDLDRKEHWVHKSQVTSSYQCVVIKARYANLRTRPQSGSSLAEIPFADRYTPFKKIDHDDEWIQVEDGAGRRGWLHESTVWAPVRSVRIEY